jgi:hypothetical protein
VHGLAGILTASEELLAVSLGEMFLLNRGHIIVRGPGQNDRASFLTLFETSTMFSRSNRLAQRTGIAFSATLFFNRNIRSTALSSNGLQPIAYTVSVGYTITPPSFTMFAQFSIPLSTPHLKFK